MRCQILETTYPDTHFPSVLVSPHPTPCHDFHPSPAPLAFLLRGGGSSSPKFPNHNKAEALVELIFLQI